ncbi:MAG: hypothetical protein K0Q92_1954 [Steroidobacteraceae bacterium]|jgi:hypothetical protein|nr:hypothetical protein [Steroidobacteraceae bacterium]
MSKKNHWAACAFACVLIATLPTRLAAQSSAPPDDFSQWGPYARLAGQTLKDVNPSGFRLHWRWQTPGQVLLEEWYGTTADSDKPAYVMTLRLGSQPGTLHLKSSTMMGKEWVGTLQDDGSVSFVGKGMLKMPYSVRIDEQGDYVQADTRGHIYRYAAIVEPSTPAASPAPTPIQAQTPTPTPSSMPAQTPVVVTAPVPAPALAPEPKPAAVAARQDSTAPPPPLKAPRKLSEADLARITQSVQKSRARSLEQARQNELQRQEAARQAQLQYQAMAAAEARRLAEEAEADAEFEAERARKAAAWQQQAQASEQALSNSMARLQNTTAQIQAQQAEAAARQRAQAEAADRAERQRQVELVRQANQRQADEAARLAAQQQQYEQQRADAQAAERARTSQRADVASAGRASTDTDANRCVSRAELRENDTFKGNTAAYVVNGCGTPVDVKICLMTDSGWKCGVTWGLAAQARWSYSAFNATSRVFVDATTAGSGRPLASPN